MTNGMNFGMDGPQVTGWWYNPKTGDKFNAVDNYFEDNNLLIKTVDGKILNYNQIQNYVHVEDPKMIPDKPVLQKTKKQDDEIPAEVLAEIETEEENDILIPDDDIYGGVKQTNKPTQATTHQEQLKQTPISQNLAIIKRALDGKNSPGLVGNICWDGFPKREIEMLVDVMQIPENEIIEYYINNISINYIKDVISQSIRDYVNKQLHNEKEQETDEIVNTFDNGMTRIKTIEKIQQDTKKKTTSKSK